MMSQSRNSLCSNSTAIVYTVNGPKKALWLIVCCSHSKGNPLSCKRVIRIGTTNSGLQNGQFGDGSSLR